MSQPDHAFQWESVRQEAWRAEPMSRNLRLWANRRDIPIIILSSCLKFALSRSSLLVFSSLCLKCVSFFLESIYLTASPRHKFILSHFYFFFSLTQCHPVWDKVNMLVTLRQSEFDSWCRLMSSFLVWNQLTLQHLSYSHKFILSHFNSFMSQTQCHLV